MSSGQAGHWRSFVFHGESTSNAKTYKWRVQSMTSIHCLLARQLVYDSIDFSLTRQYAIKEFYKLRNYNRL